MKFKIKREDEVVVIAGAHKGARGKVRDIDRNKMRVVVEGVAMRKIHEKAKGPEQPGGIVEREGSIHYSNVMLAKKFYAKAQRA